MVVVARARESGLPERDAPVQSAGWCHDVEEGQVCLEMQGLMSLISGFSTFR